MRRKRNAPLIISSIILFILTLFALFPHLFAPGDIHQTSFVRKSEITGKWEIPPYAPDKHHLLGTDAAGRDLYTRLVWGTRFTLSMAVVVAGCRFLIALTLGAIAGWRGGFLAWLTSQLAIIIAGLPLILLAFVVLETFQKASPDSAQKHYVFAVTLILLGWPRLAEQIRLLIKDGRTRPHVESAYAAGATGGRIVTRHILPLISGQLITLLAVEIAFVLIIMGQLGVLGLFPGGEYAITDPDGAVLEKLEYLPEWGQMLATARHNLGRHPWLPLFSGTMFALTVLAFNLLAEGLRRRWTPYEETTW